MEKMRFQVSVECCESFARTDVRGETIPDSRSCRAKTSSTKWDVPTSDREKVGRDRPRSSAWSVPLDQISQIWGGVTGDKGSSDSTDHWRVKLITIMFKSTDMVETWFGYVCSVRVMRRSSTTPSILTWFDSGIVSDARNVYWNY